MTRRKGPVVTRVVVAGPWVTLASLLVGTSLVVTAALVVNAPHTPAPVDHRSAAQIEADQLLVTEAGGPVDPASIAEALASPCPTEDSVNCYWLGGANHQGTPFLNVEGHIFPLDQILEG